MRTAWTPLLVIPLVFPLAGSGWRLYFNSWPFPGPLRRQIKMAPRMTTKTTTTTPPPNIKSVRSVSATSAATGPFTLQEGFQFQTILFQLSLETDPLKFKKITQQVLSLDQVSCKRLSCNGLWLHLLTSLRTCTLGDWFNAIKVFKIWKCKKWPSTINSNI